uniref:Uncharacterized protein n=1 Tax=Anguilla anguilla TaxID=7936 RepID=A0A0E9QWL4_ANGAN
MKKDTCPRTILSEVTGFICKYCTALNILKNNHKKTFQS